MWSILAHASSERDLTCAKVPPFGLACCPRSRPHRDLEFVHRQEGHEASSNHSMFVANVHKASLLESGKRREGKLLRTIFHGLEELRLASISLGQVSTSRR